MGDAGKISDARIERGLVDAENACAELVQDEAPATGTGAEVETELARLRPLGMRANSSQSLR